MASVQLRNGVYRLLFQYDRRQHALNVGPVTLSEARQWKAKIEHLLMRVKQQMLEVPIGCGIKDFLLHEGKPPIGRVSSRVRNSTLNQLREAYVKVFSNGAIEQNTLRTAKVHLDHIARTFGSEFPLATLSLPKLQDHINRRQTAVIARTIKKEIDTFRVAWNWGKSQDYTTGAFPASGLIYPKTKEVLPYMSWAEICRRIDAGGDGDSLWDCLYLEPGEVEEFLNFAKKANVRPYLYPMLVMNAHAGARRSEAMRARLEDVDIANASLTLREKKRVPGQITTRRVDMSGLLKKVLAKQMKAQVGKIYLFGDGEAELTDGQLHKAFTKLVTGSKWEVLKGYHILRHAFISALACNGVDQRIIDDFAGHSTEQQRRRYRHLFPKVTRGAIAGVFG